MQTVEDKLVTWINDQLTTRRWSQRELARQSGLSPAAISNIMSGYQKPTWGFCAAIAEPLEVHPLKLFRIAGLLTEDAPGENETGLLHLYRQLSGGNQTAAVAMLRGLAGQQGPVAQPPAPAFIADIDNACRLMARLSPARLEIAVLFVRWLLDNDFPGHDQEPAELTMDERWLAFFRRLTPAQVEMALTNLRELFGADASPAPGAGNHSQPDQAPPAAGQGKLF